MHDESSTTLVAGKLVSYTHTHTHSGRRDSRWTVHRYPLQTLHPQASSALVVRAATFCWQRRRAGPAHTLDVAAPPVVCVDLPPRVSFLSWHCRTHPSFPARARLGGGTKKRVGLCAYEARSPTPAQQKKTWPNFATFLTLAAARNSINEGGWGHLLFWRFFGVNRRSSNFTFHSPHTLCQKFLLFSRGRAIPTCLILPVTRKFFSILCLLPPVHLPPSLICVFAPSIFIF